MWVAVAVTIFVQTSAVGRVVHVCVSMNLCYVSAV